MHQNKVATASPKPAGGGTSKYCILCGNKDIQQVSKYSNLEDTEKHFLCTHFGTYLPEDSYICKKHWIEAKRHHSTPHYIPKWKSIPSAQTSPKSCIHPQCANRFSDKLVKPAFADITILEELLGVQPSSSTPFLLCPSCYNKVYRLFNPVQNCSFCGATPKPGQKFHHHSPNPVIVSKYIKDTTGTPIVISPDDWLCTSCYNTHCSIVKSTECELKGSDEMLIKCIDDWEAKAYDTDQLTKAVLSSVIFVAKYLLLQKALLLPWVCQVFLIAYGIQYTGDIKSVQVTLEVGDSSVKFSSRWLLHQLITHLDGYMMHKCIHMKFGIVLYRRGGDILAALSWALSTSQSPNQYQSEPEIQCQNPDVNKTLNEASIIVNNLIHEEIKKSSQLQPSANCALLDINEELSNINPLLLEFLAGTTNSVREREITNATEHIKKCGYILFYVNLSSAQIQGNQH